jgi:A/G-specific adenine glycosylase
MKRAQLVDNPSESAPPAAPATARKTAPRRKPAPAAPDPSPASVASLANSDAPASELNPAIFRRRLITWYRLNARSLPWRDTSDPYRIWVSEIMLQQTRVAAVIDHYNEFLRRFPTLVSLALAPEPDVLAAWSGLGYYRRARMLHKAAQFIMLEREGRLPATSIELRTLPGIGEYTAAAIASIAFGESIAVIDGNVERVLLRLTGRTPETAAAGRAFLHRQAQTLVPPKYVRSLPPDQQPTSDDQPNRAAPRASVWNASERIAIAAAAHPSSEAGTAHIASEASASEPHAAHASTTNAAGDHNQAMMELGATICLPRAPLCLQCPVYALCHTRGEHPTPPRAPQLSRPIAYLLDLRKRRTATEVLLERRPSDAALMPAMYELPPLPLDSVVGREPVLRVRHSITQTNYYVQVFAPRRPESGAAEPSRARSEAYALRRAIPVAERDLHWVRASRLATVPLTGLTRKILQRLKVMQNARLNILE